MKKSFILICNLSQIQGTNKVLLYGYIANNVSLSLYKNLFT